MTVPRRQTGPAGGDEAAQAAKAAELLRLSTVWGILLAGSGLVLAAAVIQLVLSYW